MATSKKLYVEIAASLKVQREVIQDNYTGDKKSAALTTLNATVSNLCDSFKRDNAHFDVDIFERATH